MLNYSEYISLGGAITEQEEFEKLEPMVVDLIDAYIKEAIPYWRVRPIEEYQGMDLRRVITQQVDFIAQHGGQDAFYGNSDLNFTGANTSGFSYQVNTERMRSFHDVPLSSIAKAELDYQLRISGLAGVAIW